MNILDYALAKQLFGGSGNGEVSGTLDITANGSYNVAKYARADVNIPDTSGSPIEVAELPAPTAEDVGKVYLNTTDGNYYVGESSGEFSVGATLGNKIYFDTSVKLNEYMVAGEPLQFVVASDATGNNMFTLMGMCEPSAGIYMVLPAAQSSEGLFPIGVSYIDCDGFTVEQFNEMIAPEMGLPTISNFGWQTDVVDISEFADYVVQVNDLANFGNFAYGNAKNFFNNTNKVGACADGGPFALSANITSVREYAFYWHHGLLSINLPNATSIGARAFFDCENLSTADCPNVTYISTLAFSQCRALREINFPKLEYLEDQVFGFAKLKNVYFPKLEKLSTNTFTDCKNLVSVNVPNVTLIQERACGDCHSLTKVIVGTNLTTVASLNSTNAFVNCYHLTGTVNSEYNPDGLKDGYIYVPDNLVEAYKSATNWSTYADQIKGISELPE